MDRRFWLTVAGQQVEVSVRSADQGAFNVRIGGGETIRVEQAPLVSAPSTRWLWREPHGFTRATVGRLGADLVVVLAGGTEVTVKVEDARKALLAKLDVAQTKAPLGPLQVRTQIPGRLAKILVSVGDLVKEGQPLVVVEAMKMENELRSPRDARVSSLPIVEGSTVESGTCLVVLGPKP